MKKKKMNLFENSVIYDWNADDTTEFSLYIGKIRNEKWHSIGFKQKIGVSKIKKYIIWFWEAWLLFLNRKDNKKMIFWQQFHGLLFAFYCRIFHVKKENDLSVMTFIYKKKNGIIGLIYDKFIKYIISGKYIDRYICFSKYECQYYSRYFHIDLKYFLYTTYGVKDEFLNFESSDKLPLKKEGGYLLAAGNSNRDYDFLIKEFDKSEFDLQIVDYTYVCNNCTKNITIRRDIRYGKELYELISNAYAVLVPLKDINISSGQTVFIQAMMFGKPVIVSQTNTIDDYIINEYNGLIVEKEEGKFIESVNRLVNDAELYTQLSNNARKYYLDKFSIEKMGEHIGKILG